MVAHGLHDILDTLELGCELTHLEPSLRVIDVPLVASRGTIHAVVVVGRLGFAPPGDRRPVRARVAVLLVFVC